MWLEQTQAAVGPVQVPGSAASQVGIERVRLVLLDDPDVRNSAVHTVAEGKVDQAVDTGVGHDRLRPDLGQHLEPAALAAGHDQGQHLAIGHAQSLLPALACRVALKRPDDVGSDLAPREVARLRPYRLAIDQAGVVASPCRRSIRSNWCAPGILARTARRLAPRAPPRYPLH